MLSSASPIYSIMFQAVVLVTVVEEVLIVTVMILVSNKMTVVRTTPCSAKLLISLYQAATVDVARYPRMDVSVMKTAAK